MVGALGTTPKNVWKNLKRAGTAVSIGSYSIKLHSWVEHKHSEIVNEEGKC